MKYIIFQVFYNGKIKIIRPELMKTVPDRSHDLVQGILHSCSK